MNYHRHQRDHWTLNNCQKEALKYDTRTEWALESSPSYAKARMMGWLEICCSHMMKPIEKKPLGYWTKEKCREEALKYSNASDWMTHGRTSYDLARKNGWREEFSKHMKRKPITLKECKESAKQYTTKTEWALKGRKYYAVAIQNRWISLCCTHMEDKIKPHRYWTKERVTKEAKKYRKKSDWHKKSGSSYTIARRYGWFDEIVSKVF